MDAWKGPDELTTLQFNSAQIIIVVGETGSGKTTQCVAFYESVDQI